MIKILKNNFFYFILMAIIMANILPFAINNVLAEHSYSHPFLQSTNNENNYPNSYIPQQSTGIVPSIGTVPDSGGFKNPLGKDATIFTILQKIIKYLIMIGAPILAIMVIYGGYLILTAGDDPEKVKGGKNTILYGVIGYIIVLSSYGVIFIIGEVLGATKLK